MAKGVRREVDLAAGSVPIFFHSDQLVHRPQFEWQSGEKILHPESSTRAEGILLALDSNRQKFVVLEPEPISEESLLAVHSADLLAVYKAVSGLSEEEEIYPSVFPVAYDRKSVDPSNPHHAGAFCLDAGTPLVGSTWSSALWSAAGAVAAARHLAQGQLGKIPSSVSSGRLSLSYALCRPPGHHATRDQFGGYCYLNNAALAANELAKFGRVAIVDIDFHHGNGTQSIFFDSDVVLFVSIHGDPRVHYPYFWGYESEQGAGKGLGYNINIPLPQGTGSVQYLEAVQQKVLPALRSIEPRFLVISAGFDTARGDPLGSFDLVREDFLALGKMFGGLGVPVCVVQEGGYDTADLGNNVLGFLEGAIAGVQGH